MTIKKRLPKVNRYTGNATGYGWDNAALAFGDPFDLISKRDCRKEWEKDYQALYRADPKPKSRAKILRKNEML
jgi:hypothetical protein